MTKFRMLEFFLVLWGIASSLVIISTTNIQADMMVYIPTVINGLVSAISLIIGFSGVIMAFGVSNHLISFEENRYRILFTLVFLALPIAFLWPMYHDLVSGNVSYAFEETMIAFLIGQIVIIDLIMFMVRSSLGRRRKNPQVPDSNV